MISELHESMKANVKQNILIAEDYIESLPIQIVLYHQKKEKKREKKNLSTDK